MNNIKYYLDMFWYIRRCDKLAKKLNIDYIVADKRIFIEINKKKVGLYKFRDFYKLLLSCKKFESNEDFLAKINVK